MDHIPYIVSPKGPDYADFSFVAFLDHDLGFGVTGETATKTLSIFFEALRVSIT